MTTEQNLKIKLTLGYILLILIFTLSIVYILREVKNINLSKDDILIENNKVIQLGNIMSDLYAAENTGRMALLSYEDKYAVQYHKQLDTLLLDIKELKDNNIKNKQILLKLDSISEIITLKNQIFNKVLTVREQYSKYNIYTEAQQKLKDVQTKPSQDAIKVDTTVTKIKFLDRFFSSRVKKHQEERLKEENEKIQKQQKQFQQKITKQTEGILKTAQKKEYKYFKEYQEKESLLIQKNKELSQQLRKVLVQVEKILIDNSNSKYDLNKKVIDKVSYNIAIVGILTSVVALFFGFIILRDLNKSTRNKVQLEKLNKSMIDLAKQKSYLMATISHDMVSPLNSLMGFSTLLKNTLKTPKQKEYLDSMQLSTQYIKNLVDDLSLFSNLEYNNIKIKKAKFNFNELIKNVISNLKSFADAKKIDLNVTIDPKLDNHFFSDSHRIQQILVNVISNAIKFTHKGQVKINADLLENNKIKIEVSDTGIGIAKENHNKVFKEFVQVHNAIDNRYGGSGLGLNITKRLVKLLKGNIDFKSEINKGTTFYIQLPIEEYNSTELTTIKEGYEYDNERKLQNKNILVIDDDILQLKLLNEIFQSKVNIITTLDNGKMVKETILQQHYHLIITDMQMPHYNGIDVIKDIRSIDKYKHTPVIALTGKMDLDEAEYRKLGFSYYIKKPINIDTLYNIIYKMLRIKPKENISTNKANNEFDTNEDFDLSELLNLLDNDQVAVKEIIDAFIINAEEDIHKIKHAALANDKEVVSALAHKMLPMFRQLRIESCVKDLETLERNITQLKINELNDLVYKTHKKVMKILNKLRKKI